MKANKRKARATISGTNFRFLKSNSGQKATITKNIKKTIQKLLPGLVFFS